MLMCGVVVGGGGGQVVEAKDGRVRSIKELEQAHAGCERGGQRYREGGREGGKT